MWKKYVIASMFMCVAAVAGQCYEPQEAMAADVWYQSANSLRGTGVQEFYLQEDQIKEDVEKREFSVPVKVVENGKLVENPTYIFRLPVGKLWCVKRVHNQDASHGFWYVRTGDPFYKLLEACKPYSRLVKEYPDYVRGIRKIPKCELAHKELSKYTIYDGYLRTVGVTSYGHSDKGFLAYSDGESGADFHILDRINNRPASVYMDTKIGTRLKDLYTSNAPIVVVFNIETEEKVFEKRYNVWHGKYVLLPVYIAYTVDKDRKIIPKQIYTGKRVRLGDFHERLHDQKDIDLVNLFLEELPALLEDGEDLEFVEYRMF